MIDKNTLRNFSLRADMATASHIDQELRKGASLNGSSAWLLICAIVIASVGLNVNSTAVIIGAMLISPLMGPIVGAGYGAAIFDNALLRRSLMHLLVGTLISLMVSTVYFMLSPLGDVQSELLARTSPTLWDVLIAFFGGFAGIIGTTRTEKNTVIPGVAIATALMPPLCTAGFGLAHREWAFTGGALYLFTINSVFIALAASVGIRIMGIKRQVEATESGIWRLRLIAAIVLLCTVVPSAFLAARYANEAMFRSDARAFIHAAFRYNQTQVVKISLDPTERRIEVTLLGAYLDATEQSRLSKRLLAAGLKDTRLVMYQRGRS